MKVFIKLINSCGDCPEFVHREGLCLILNDDVWWDEDFDSNENIFERCPLQELKINK
jgi:hypothetical protein